ALASLESKKALNTDALIALFEGGLFYRSQTLDMIRVGLDRYFVHDYVSAIHILVPQLEDTLRDAIDTLGVSRTSFQQGMTGEKPLDIVLATPELRAVLGEDLASFFDKVLGN